MRRVLHVLTALMVVTCMVIGVARQSSAAPGASDDGTPDPTSGAPPQYDLPAATEDGPADAEALRIPFDDGAVPEAVAKAAHDHRDAPLGHRITAISEAMMGTPYLNDATGEGAAPDFDPPARYDAYDCLTFVEEVLALSLAPDVRGAAAVRDSLRYGEGKPQTYENRLHFMLQQWVPKALEAGWLRDITAELGETRLMRKTVSLRNWQWWKGRRLFLIPDETLPTGSFQMQVLTPGAAWDAAPNIPDGAVVLTVRESKDHVPIIVTHLGFKVSSAIPEKPFFRHATKMGKRPRVRNDWLRWYVEHNRWYHWWPVAGFTVLMPQEAGPRLSRLAAEEERITKAEAALKAQKALTEGTH